MRKQEEKIRVETRSGRASEAGRLSTVRRASASVKQVGCRRRGSRQDSSRLLTSALLLVPVRTVITVLVWDGERYALFAIRADELGARMIEWKIEDIDRNARTG